MVNMDQSQEFHKLERWWDDLVERKIDELKKQYKEKYDRMEELRKDVQPALV